MFLVLFFFVEPVRKTQGCRCFAKALSVVMSVVNSGYAGVK